MAPFLTLGLTSPNYFNASALIIWFIKFHGSKQIYTFETKFLKTLFT